MDKHFFTTGLAEGEYVTTAGSRVCQGAERQNVGILDRWTHTGTAGPETEGSASLMYCGDEFNQTFRGKR
jgi:hypothetical protein